MKIGIFTDSYKPYTSGVVTSIMTFKEELSRLGHEIFVFAPKYPHYNEDEDGVYRFYSLPSPTNPDFTLAIPILPGLNMLIKKLNLDIIHVHSPFTMGRVGLRYARKYNIPIVFTFHTLYDQYVHYVPVAHELAKEVTIKYSDYFCNQCDHVVVPTSEVEQILHNREVKTPVTVIPTGVPLHKYTKTNGNWLRSQYDIPEGTRILLFAGRLTREKNLEFLIKAFKKIKNEIVNTCLVLTAQGPQESELKKLVLDLGMSLEKDVIFTGSVPFDILVDIYFSSDLFVFSSMTETQGLVLIEAMAAGLPVVAVRAYGVQDMVDNGVNGFLTSPNLNDFADAVCTLLQNDTTYCRFQKNALKKAESLSSANMAQKLEALYNRLYETNRPRRHRTIDITSWFGS
jgi:glycosyltransferase involved in cell wall biosynthesis